MISENIFKGGFGLERETMRVDKNGVLAKTPHPFKKDCFVRDFCEYQLELITPVCGSTELLMKKLEEMDCEIKNTLKDEYLWLYSNPPHFETDEDIIIADYCGTEAGKRRYREYLADKYGKRIMMYSGIHLNFSFDEVLLRELHKGEGSFENFKNDLYFRLSKQVFRYSWLLVLLTAASPVYDNSLKEDFACGTGFDGHSSLRNGENGYWNSFVPILDYSDLNAHISSMNEYVDRGELFSAAELYLPVRLKPRGSNCLENLNRNGVNHIELRMFDINPLAPHGIFKEDLDFAHYMLIYLMYQPDFELTAEGQLQTVQNHKSAAKYDIRDIEINGRSAVDEAMSFLGAMSEFFKDFPTALENIAIQRDKLMLDKRYCVRIYERYRKDLNRRMLEDIQTFF